MPDIVLRLAEQTLPAEGSPGGAQPAAGDGPRGRPRPLHGVETAAGGDDRGLRRHGRGPGGGTLRDPLAHRHARPAVGLHGRLDGGRPCTDRAGARHARRARHDAEHRRQPAEQPVRPRRPELHRQLGGAQRSRRPAARRPRPARRRDRRCDRRRRRHVVQPGARRRGSRGAARAASGCPATPPSLLVLKRLDDAERDGDTVLAVVFDDPGDDTPSTCTSGSATAARSLEPWFGHAHAASGLVHVAAAVLALHHRVAPGGVPLLPSSSSIAATGCGPRAGPRSLASRSRRWTASANGRSCSPRPPTTRHRRARRRARLHMFSGRRRTTRCSPTSRSGATSTSGPVRLVIVADGDAQLGRARRARPPAPRGGLSAGRRRALPRDADRRRAGLRVHRRPGRRITGWAPSCSGRSRRSSTRAGDGSRSREVARWIYEPERPPTPTEYLWGTAMLSQAHARLDVGRAPPRTDSGDRLLVGREQQPLRVRRVVRHGRHATRDRRQPADGPRAGGRVRRRRPRLGCRVGRLGDVERARSRSPR